MTNQRSIIADNCDLKALCSRGLPPLRWSILSGLCRPASAAELIKQSGRPNMLEGRELRLRTGESTP